MKERILNYMAYIDQLLADDAGKNEEDYEKIMENGVQKMYRQYDEMYKRARAQSNPPQK